MQDTHNLKQNDTSPSLLYALDPVTTDLTGATVRFNMRLAVPGGAVKVNRAAAVVVTPTGTPTVRYDWQSADADTAGFFEAEFEVTYAGGAVETFPNVGFIAVTIGDDIA
ncbi:MAG: hypothetical protein V4720_06245 [Pseudomonadota bacterium]